jgi:hypothetical protein
MYFGIKMFPFLILPLFLANVTTFSLSPIHTATALPIDPALAQN